MARPHIARTPRALVLALGAAALLSACQTKPQVNADLAAARSAVEQARANPYAARVAAVDVERAQQALQRAEAAKGDDAEHLSYVARRRAEAVLALAAQAQSEERLRQASTERERMQLEARTREAAAATEAARAAQGQVAQSQQAADAARQQAASEAERAAALERDLQSLRGRSTQRGMVVTLGDVLFATGKATLQPGAQRSVQRLAQVLQQYPERRVLIEGFTDSTGSDEANMKLSQQRAEAFKQALLGAGVAAQRIDVRAHGEEMPVADNKTAAGRQQNRRVEIVFSDAQGRFAAN